MKKSVTSPAIAQEIRRLINGGNKCHPALIAALAKGHHMQAANTNRTMPSAHNGQAITAQQQEQLG